MGPINDKDGVVRLLERLERVSREIKGLPSFAKCSIAVNAGCLETDLDELEGLVAQACDVVREMYDSHETGNLDITDSDHSDAIIDALDSLGDCNERTQIKVIKTAIEMSDCFDANIEGLNSMLEDAGKEWFVITRSEATELKNLVDSMLPEQ